MIHLNLEQGPTGPSRFSVWAPIPTISRSVVAARFFGWPSSIRSGVFHWVVFSAIGVREAEAQRAATMFVGSHAIEEAAAEDFSRRIHAVRGRRSEDGV